MLKCIHCNKTLKGSQVKWCSKICRGKARNKGYSPENLTMLCLNCRVPLKGEKKWCSRKCLRDYPPNNKKKRERDIQYRKKNKKKLKRKAAIRREENREKTNSDQRNKYNTDKEFKKRIDERNRKNYYIRREEEGFNALNLISKELT